MSYNNPSTAREIESSPVPEQSNKSPVKVLAKIVVYLIAGILVAAITVLVFLFG